MGPTNVALVRLFMAETDLREAQRRLDAVTKNVRLQQRKVEDLTQRHQTAHSELTHLKAKTGEYELDIKAHDGKIDQFREQQAQAQTNREYQAFLVQINTHKVDRAKSEEESLKLMEQVEALQKEHDTLVAQLAAEISKLEEMRSSIDQRVKELTAEVDAARPNRDTAAEAVPVKALDTFNRLASKFDGEAMAPIEKPHPKREEYICAVCNLDLTLDVYNRLHSRDELVMCPSGNHLLYIPADLPPEKAVHKPKEKKTRGRKESDLAAPVPRQTLATSVVPSIEQEEEESDAASAEMNVDAPANHDAPAESVAAENK
ncbi:MAG: hypothetical protein H7144_14760 [Burkholderiales bacterium]|nr:hypothetical protein [Phycisphaerae bacterium]